MDVAKPGGPKVVRLTKTEEARVLAALLLVPYLGRSSFLLETPRKARGQSYWEAHAVDLALACTRYTVHLDMGSDAKTITLAQTHQWAICACGFSYDELQKVYGYTLKGHVTACGACGQPTFHHYESIGECQSCHIRLD